MPRVPVAQNTVGLAGGVTARVDVPNMAAGGEMIGRALRGFGQDVGDVAHDFEVVAAAQDNAATKEAATSVDARANDLLFTGSDPYFEKRGKSALDARVDTEHQLDDAVAEARKGLKTKRQQEMFDERVGQQRLGWGTRIADHAHTQAFKYDDEQSEASAVMAGQSATANYTDPQESRKYLDQGLAEIEHRGSLNGWGGAVTTVKKLEFANGVHQDVGTRLSAEGPQGPVLATKYADAHRGEMTADGYEAVLTHARVQQNALDAEQHRIEADAKRDLREARAAKKASAESVYRNTQDGIVVAPKDLAQAMTDASDAGDPALVEGLRQGGLKNNLTQQYANATPAELQERVNALSADITKAGGKVEPDKMVERDHLQTLLSKNRSALNQDPLSWGAEHLGIQIQKLNLNDPASVNQRVQQALTIARRTGTEPRPLMQDEVAASQQTLQHGTTQDKVGLAMRLARLGPLALPAAEQLTSNPAYLNIIGLATHSNRGVAASRVNQIITGYDALKTKPKLIDKDVATQQFNDTVGAALQFLPQVRQGVLSNAQALLAAQANEHGWDDWNSAQGGWVPAINSALGAYSRDGKRVGGLWTYNGGVTVLPENMTGTEFEDRISKSNGPEFRKAQNGEPDFSGSATDLKRMQWVPSGDGVYRISNGNGFLKTKPGGFYEIDVTKLNSFDAQLTAHGYTRH